MIFAREDHWKLKIPALFSLSSTISSNWKNFPKSSLRKIGILNTILRLRSITTKNLSRKSSIAMENRQFFGQLTVFNIPRVPNYPHF